MSLLSRRWFKPAAQKGLGAEGSAQAGVATLNRKRCCEILNCSAKARAACAAPQRPEIPCWAARQIAGQPLPLGCGACPVRTFAGNALNAIRPKPALLL